MALRDEYEGFIPSEREQDVTPQIKPEQPPVREEGAAEPVAPSPVVPGGVVDIEQQVAALDIDIPAKPEPKVIIPEGSPVVEPEEPYTAYDEERARQTALEKLDSDRRVSHRDLSQVHPDILRQYKGIVPGDSPLTTTSTPLGYAPRDAHLLLNPKAWREAQNRHKTQVAFSNEKQRQQAEEFRETLSDTGKEMFDWSLGNFPKEAKEALFTSAQSFRKVLSHDTPALIELGFKLRYFIGAHAHNIPDAINNIGAAVNNWDYNRTANGINNLEGYLNRKPYEPMSPKLYTIEDEDGNVKLDEDDNIEYVSWDAKARWQMEKFGIAKVLKELGDFATQGVSVSEKDRDFLDRTLAYGIEIGTPLFILPWMGFARFSMKAFGGNKALDKVMMNRFLSKEAKALAGDDDEYADVMVKLLRKKMGKDKPGYDPATGTSTVDLKYTKVAPGDPKLIEPGEKTVKWVHGRDPDEKFWKKVHSSFKIQDGFSRSAAAGIYGAGSDLLLRETFGADYQEKYGFIPYIFAMAGYMRGGRDIERAAFRLPGAAFPFTGDLASSLFTPRMWIGIPNAVVYNGIGMTLWAMEKIRNSQAGTRERLGDLRAPDFRQKGMWWGQKLDKFQNHPMGKLMKYIAAGGDVIKGWAELGKAIKTGNMETFDRMTATLRASPKAVGRLAQSMRALAPGQQEAMIEGHGQMLNLMQDMVTAHGPQGWDQQFLMINQMLGLQALESMRNQTLKGVEFGTGFLSKVGLFATGAGDLGLSRRSLLSRFDVLDNIFQKQIGLLATNLRQLKNSPGATEFKLKRIIETAERALIKENRAHQQYLRKREALAEHMEAVKAGWPAERLGRFAEEAQASGTGGLSWKKYDDNPESYARLTDQAVDEIVIARRKAYDVDGLGTLSFSHQSMKQRGKGFYNQINKEELFPASGFIDDLSEEVISTNYAIMSMIGAETKIGSKKALISYARKNYMNKIDAVKTPEKMKEFVDEVEMLVELEGIRLKNVTDPKKFFTNLKETLDEQGAGAIEGTVLALSKLTPRTPDGVEALGEILPALLRIEDGHLLRMSAWGRVNDGNLTGFDLSQAYNAAFMTDRIFDKSLLDTDQALEVLSKIGKTKDEITVQLRLRETAQKWYKENIGEVWKSYLGRRMMPADREIMDVPTPPTTQERFTEFLLDERKIDGEIMGISIFNKIFPKGTGNVDLKTYDSMTKMEGVTLTRTQRDLRNEAKKFIAHSFSLRIREEGPAFLERVTEGHWRALRQAGILEPEAVVEILKYTKGVKLLSEKKIPKDIKLLYKRINDNLKTLGAMEQRRLEDSFSSVILPGRGISSESIVRALFDVDFAKSLKFSVDEVGQELGQLIDSVERVRRMKQLHGSGTTKELEESLQAFRESEKGLTPQIWEKPIDILLDAVKDNPSLIDDIEDLIFDYIHRNAISFTETRKPLLGLLPGLRAKDVGVEQIPISPIREAEGLTEETLTKAGYPGAFPAHHSIVARTARVDFDKLEDNISKAMPILARIYQFRMNRGGKEMIESANKGFNSLKKLRRIFDYSVITQGRVKGKGMINYPKVLGRKQVGGRLYNWARGFVHPGYLVAESTFMRLGMGEAKLISDVLFDPKAITILEAAIVEGRQITLNQLGYIMNLTRMAMQGGRAIAGERKVTEATLADMANFYIHFTDKLPPAYIKRQQKFEAQRQIDLRLKSLRSRGKPRVADPAHLYDQTPLFGL